MDENDAPQNRSNDDAELSKSSDEHVSSCKRREKKLQSNYGQYVSYASLYAEVSFGLCDFSNFFFLSNATTLPSCQFHGMGK